MSNEREGDKKDQGKLRFNLFPVRALRELVKNYTQGAEVNGDRNWEKGFEFTRCFDAIQRHAWDWLDGEDYDITGPNPSGIHHMACVAFWSLALVEFHFTHPELDDRAKVTVEDMFAGMDRVIEHQKTMEKLNRLKKIVPDVEDDYPTVVDEPEEDCCSLNLEDFEEETKDVLPISEECSTCSPVEVIEEESNVGVRESETADA